MEIRIKGICSVCGNFHENLKRNGVLLMCEECSTKEKKHNFSLKRWGY